MHSWYGSSQFILRIFGIRETRMRIANSKSIIFFAPPPLCHQEFYVHFRTLLRKKSHAKIGSVLTKSPDLLKSATKPAKVWSLSNNNTSLVAPGALAHRLQCRTAWKFQNGRQGAPKWPTVPGKVLPLGFWALQTIFAKQVFQSEHSFCEKRSRQRKNGKKIMTFIVATNVVASRPSERRPTGTPHARANLVSMVGRFWATNWIWLYIAEKCFQTANDCNSLITNSLKMLKSAIKRSIVWQFVFVATEMSSCGCLYPRKSMVRNSNVVCFLFLKLLYNIMTWQVFLREAFKRKKRKYIGPPPL